MIRSRPCRDPVPLAAVVAEEALAELAGMRQ